MFIVAERGQTYCRLRFSVGPGCDVEIPCGVDYAAPFDGRDEEAWLEEYAANVEGWDVFQGQSGRSLGHSSSGLQDPFFAEREQAWDDFCRRETEMEDENLLCSIDE